MYNIHKLYITIFIITVVSSTETKRVKDLREANKFLSTNVTKLEPLLKTQKKMIDDLEEYIRLERSKLYVFEKHLEVLKKEHSIAVSDIPKYLKNSVNAYTLIKRLTYDLEFIETISNESINYTRDDSQSYPTYEDLDGAVQILALLLKFRQITASTEDLSSELTTSDCYVIANNLKSAGDWEKAIEWYLQAHAKFNKKTPDAYAFRYIDLVDEISFAYYSIDDARNTLKWLTELMEINPESVTTETTEIINKLKNRIAAENAAAPAAAAAR